MRFAELLSIEGRKFLASRVAWSVTAVLAAMPLLAALGIVSIMSPGGSERLRLVALKMAVLGITIDWPGYLMMLMQTTATLGVLVHAITVGFVFGREYAEGTVPVLFTLPVPRHEVVGAKLAVVTLWFALAITAMIGVGLAVGTRLDLPGFTDTVIADGLRDNAIVAGLTALQAPVIALATTASRSSLVSVGLGIALLYGSVAVGATPFGPYLPWAAVAQFAGIDGIRLPEIAPGSLAMCVAFSGGGLAALLAHVRHADVA